MNLPIQNHPGGPIELFLVPAHALNLCNKGRGMYHIFLKE